MLDFPNIDPVILSFGPIQIRWYGLAYLGGILGGFSFFWQRFKTSLQLTNDQIFSLMTYIILGIMVGGRLGFVLFYHPLYFFEHPFEVFAIWQGGMSYHGGALGAMASFLIFGIRYRCSTLILLDFLGIGSTLGLFLGRLSNFVNGELYGRVTTVPWGMVFPSGGPLPRHPSQLYEAFFEGIVLFLILFLLDRHVRLLPGRLFSCYLVGYGIFRFFIEFFREPDAHLGVLFLGLSLGQYLCVVMMFFGGLFWWSCRSIAGPK